MNYSQTCINNLMIVRKNALRVIEGLSDEQLLKIPSGFNNNLLWQLGHIVCSGQTLSYKFSGLPIGIPEQYPEMFGKGTSPKTWTSQPDIAEIKRLMISTLEQTSIDIEAGVFKEFTSYPTSFGIELQSFEESFMFRQVHEGLHLGSMMALKKLV